MPSVCRRAPRLRHRRCVFLSWDSTDKLHSQSRSRRDMPQADEKYYTGQASTKQGFVWGEQSRDFAIHPAVDPAPSCM